MKKSILFLIAIFLTFVACDKNEPGKSSQIKGLWKTSSIVENGEVNTSSTVYIQFNEDDSYKYYNIIKGSNTVYKYDTGNFSIKEDSLILIMDDYRAFVDVNQVPRMGYMQLESYKYSYHIIEKTADKLQFETENTVYTLEPVSALPDNWNSEFSESQVQMATNNIVGVEWDRVSCYTHEQWWWFDNPDWEGFTLQSDGTLNFNFWGFYLLGSDAIYDAEAGETGFGYASSDFYWTYNKPVITIGCNKYYAYISDSDGNILNRREVIFNPPLEREFIVFFLTEHYMVLYSNLYNQYEVFHKNTTSSKANTRTMINEKQRKAIAMPQLLKSR